MNRPGEGFAFAAWVRGNLQTGNWLVLWAHGMKCSFCRNDWSRLNPK
jgi:hypothetical protein